MKNKGKGINVFVYGTLMSGFRLNYYMRSINFEPAILEDYIRVNIMFPVALKKKGHKIVGEVYYDVSDSVLEDLVGMEYNYKPIADTVKTLDGTEVVATLFYPKGESQLEEAEYQYSKIYKNKKGRIKNEF